YRHRVRELRATWLSHDGTVFDDGASDTLTPQPGRDVFIGDFRRRAANKDKAPIGGRANERTVQVPSGPQRPFEGRPRRLAGVIGLFHRPS
ncbi:hypothetical protein ACYOEI_27220, partial [Singulisphaera rosea]